MNASTFLSFDTTYLYIGIHRSLDNHPHSDYIYHNTIQYLSGPVRRGDATEREPSDADVMFCSFFQSLNQWHSGLILIDIYLIR